MTRVRAAAAHAPAPTATRLEYEAGSSSADLADTAVVQSGAAANLAAKAGAENFPVALRLLPRRHRHHLMAVYLFARTVDDIGDLAPPPERLGLLQALAADLGRLYEGGAVASMLPAVRGLATTVTECGIPMQPFVDLIRANEQDQVVSRYETFEDLVGYCELSANPVGRIVLHVFGCATRSRVAMSDSICTALQVIEHLQDVAEDLRAGRIYLPQADLRRHGCSEADLAAQTASPPVQRLIAAEADRARALLTAGSPLVGTLTGAARLAVAGYLAGGRATLAALDRAGYDVLATAVKPAKGRTAAELVNALVAGR